MKFKTIILTAALTAVISVSAFAQGITVSLNGSNVSFGNQQPVVVEGRTLIPLRGVFDKMGYTIDWNGDTKTVTLIKDGSTIVINIGESCYHLNGSRVAIDVPAQIMNGSTMLPLRAIADATGSQVYWDAETKTVTILEDKEATAPEGKVTNMTLEEAAYIKAYSEVFETYNPIALNFVSFTTELSQKGVSSKSELAELKAQALVLNQASVKAKSTVASLSTPARFNDLSKKTTNYIQSLEDLTNLLVDYIDGKISDTDFETKFNSLMTSAAKNEADYQAAFEAITK